MKKLFVLLGIFIFLYGCQSIGDLNIDSVITYLNAQVEQNDCIRNTKAEHVEGYVFIRYYFYDEFSPDDKASVISAALEFFSQLEIQSNIREYYSEEYNDGKLDRLPPTIVIEIYNETSNRPLYTYENSLMYHKVEDGRMKYIYDGWAFN